MSERKRLFSLLSPIKNKITRKRRNIDQKPSPSHIADESDEPIVYTSASVSNENSPSTTTNSDIDVISSFTSVLNKAIKDNSLQTSPILLHVEQSNDIMDPKNFALVFSQALTEDSVCQGLRKAMRPLTDPIENKLDNAIKRIDNLEISVDENNVKIDNIEHKLDEIEKYARKDNIRLVGIPELTTNTLSGRGTQQTENETTSSTVVNFLKDAMNLDIHQYDIGNSYRLGQLNRTDRTRPRDILVQFTSNLVKQLVMRNRRKLRDSHRTIFINDDLTQRNALLFQKAREEIRNRKLHAAWTRDGNVYAKLHDNSKPTKIDYYKDLSELIRN